MNIKTMNPHITALDQSRRPDASHGVKTGDASKDRDGDGRRDPSPQPQKTKLTDEELETVLNHIKALPGVIENHLKVQLILRNDLKFILIEDLHGQVVRRIPESELWALYQHDINKKTGQILDKAM